MTVEITEFIEARLREWEALARDSTELRRVTVKYPAKRPPWEPERWELDEFRDLVSVNGQNPPMCEGEWGGGPRSVDVASLIAEFDPARAYGLAQVFRALLALHECRPPSKYMPVAWCDPCHGDGYAAGPGWPCQTVRYIASIWGGHSDYRDEWRP